MRAEGATSLYDGLAATMMRATDTGRRQLIVAFTDGRDSTSVIDESTAKAIAQMTDAVVDIVVPVAGQAETAAAAVPARRRHGGLARRRRQRHYGARGGVSSESVPLFLTDLVTPTAGQVLPLRPDQSISGIFKALLDDFRSTYVLQYVAQGVDGAGWHEVEVSVKKRGKYDIRARKGYRGRGTISPTEEIR